MGVIVEVRRPFGLLLWGWRRGAVVAVIGRAVAAGGTVVRRGLGAVVARAVGRLRRLVGRRGTVVTIC